MDVSLEAAADRLADLINERVHHAVVHVAALLAPRNDARAQEQSKMPRDVGLTGPNLPHDLDHAALTLPEHIQDAEPGRVGEHAQPPRHGLEELFRQSHA